MMMFMPIMFGFMFLWAPSGAGALLVRQQLWAIGQQYFTNRMIGPPASRGAAAGRAAGQERRQRKTDQARRSSVTT